MGRLRTFLAIDPGKAILARCIALQETLALAGADVKWVERDNLHITLLFLGEVVDRELPDLCRAVAGCCADRDAFDLSVESVGCFPNPRRPRVVWAGTGDGSDETIALHDALEAPLLELGCYRREARRYTPHLTLGRVESDRSVDALTAALTQQTKWVGGETTVREVRVFSSELTKRGPVYSVLSRAKLRIP